MDFWDKRSFFSKSTPNLISNRTLKKLQKVLNTDNQAGGSNDFFTKIYNDYISPNIFVIMLLLIFILFLIFQYHTNKDKKKISKQYNLNHENIDNIETIQNIKNFKPTFNPSAEISVQDSYTNYLGDFVPDSYKAKMGIREEKPVPQVYGPIVNYIEDRDSYVGYNNPYLDSKDQEFPHPYKWNTNYNTSTQSAIEFASEKNNLSLQQLNNPYSPFDN
jgi:hypothetical protein